MYFIYNILSHLAAVLLIPWMAFRLVRGRLPGLAQRLGFLPLKGDFAEGATVWIHAVSLGEVKAAAALVTEIRNALPGVRIVITASTRTGHSAAAQIVREGDAVFFPPLDLAWVCRRFLRRINPDAVVVMETELWPNLFREAKRHGAALLLANGRISDRAFARYRASRFLWRRVLSHPDLLFLQSPEGALRFQALGAAKEKIRMAGNLKFAARPQASPFADLLEEAIRRGDVGPVLVAGSTMPGRTFPGEEKFLLASFLELAETFPRLWMILAPRHPERFAAVAEEVRSLGLPLQLRSAWRAGQTPQVPGVLLLDSIGELASVYRLATVAFVGGTLVETGGHNLLEPACFARPIVIGPHMENFREIAAQFLEGAAPGWIPGRADITAGAAVQVANAEGLSAALRFLFENPESCRTLGEAARNIVETHSGGAHVIAEELGNKMSARETPRAEAAQWAVAGTGKAK